MEKEFKDTIELVSNVLDAFTAGLFLFDDDKQRLKLVAWHTLSRHLNPETELRPGDGIIGWVAKSGQSVNVSHFDRDARSLNLYRQAEEIKSFLAVPVGQEGVLCVDSKHSYVFTDKDQKLLAGFAQLFLHVLSARRVRQLEKGYARMLRLFYEVDRAVRDLDTPGRFISSLLEELKRFSRTDLAFFTTPNAQRTRYRVDAADGLAEPNFEGTSYALDSGLVGWVYRKKRPLVLKRVQTNGQKSYIFAPDDPVKGFQAFIGLPLNLWGATIAVLGLAAYGAREWNSDEVHVLTMTGQWAAAALGALAA